jgi:hypothetical protein
VVQIVTPPDLPLSRGGEYHSPLLSKEGLGEVCPPTSVRQPRHRFADTPSVRPTRAPASVETDAYPQQTRAAG